MIDKIFSIIFSIASYYPSLPKAKIVQIYENRFKPKNLYKFCHLKGREDKNNDENIIFEHDQMKIKKVTGTLCNFGNTIDIWLDGFLNYFLVIVNFLKIAFSSLFWALMTYHSIICHLSRIYN